MPYKDLSPSERVSAVHLDLLKDPEYSRVGPTTQLGVVRIAGPECPTAKTNGLDCWYNGEWVLRLSRQQLRYVVCHEQMHKMFMHCTLYNAAFKKHPNEAGQAVDYVVNLAVEDMDKGRHFVERPTDYPPLIDEKYRDWNCIEVLADLIRNKPPGPLSGGGGGGKTLDEHEQREPGDGDAEAAAAETQMVNDARVQGEITSSRMRGEGAGSASLKGFEQTDTDWRDPLQQFMQDSMEGDEQSRWCPPNKLFRPLGILLPSHYDESAGDLVVACDTSASMRRYYARVFGEIGRVCEQVQPKSVVVIWWDTKVAGVQTFLPVDYPQMKDKLNAKGGGGTRVSCVAAHMKEHSIRPQATIILTDGEIESAYECPPGPLLWGIVGHAHFRPLRGQLLRIGKETLL